MYKFMGPLLILFSIFRFLCFFYLFMNINIKKKKKKPVSWLLSENKAC